MVGPVPNVGGFRIDERAHVFRLAGGVRHPRYDGDRPSACVGDGPYPARGAAVAGNRVPCSLHDAAIHRFDGLDSVHAKKRVPGAAGSGACRVWRSLFLLRRHGCDHEPAYLSVSVLAAARSARENRREYGGGGRGDGSAVSLPLPPGDRPFAAVGLRHGRDAHLCQNDRGIRHPGYVRQANRIRSHDVRNP